MNLRLGLGSLKITPNTTFMSPLSRALAETYSTCAVAPKSKKSSCCFSPNMSNIYACKQFKHRVQTSRMDTSAHVPGTGLNIKQPQ